MRRRRFKSPILQTAYDRAVASGKTWTVGSGNGARFWKGYNMAKNGIVFPQGVYQRGTPAYAYWAAGQDIANKEMAS